MKSLIAVGLLSLTTLAQAEIRKECWDGSFGYNYVRAVETSRGLEVTFTGSTLKLPALYENWNTALKIENNTSSRPKVHVVLPLASKVENADGSISFSSKTIVTETAEGWLQETIPTLWLERWTTSLGQSQVAITDIPADVLKVTLGEEKVTLELKQARAPGEPKLQKLALSCQHTGVPDDVVLSQSIADFLDAQAKTPATRK